MTVSDLKRFGQRVPVIITADGKLVDGNRRRSAFHQISLDNITHARNFKRMRVCILPDQMIRIGQVMQI